MNSRIGIDEAIRLGSSLGYEMDDWCYRQQFCTDETMLGWGATWVNRVNSMIGHLFALMRLYWAGPWGITWVMRWMIDVIGYNFALMRL